MLIELLLSSSSSDLNFNYDDVFWEEIKAF